jgi:hypothetical protein
MSQEILEIMDTLYPYYEYDTPIISLLKILSLSLPVHFGIHHLAFRNIRLRRIRWMLTVP